MTSLMAVLPRRSVATRFGALGALLGKFPWASAGLFLLLCILAPALIGLWLGIRLEISLDEGFVPREAPSHWEISMQKNFFRETGQSREWYMALFGVARPHNTSTSSSPGNMLRPDCFDEFNNFYERVTKRMVLSTAGENGDGSSGVTYAQICHPLCDINDQLQKLMENSWLEILGQVQMRYPVSRVLSYDVNIGKHVFNRTVDSNGKLKSAQYMAFYFSSFIHNATKARQLELFERMVAEEAAKHNQQREGRRVELIVHGANTVQEEMGRGVLDEARNAAIGLTLGVVAFASLHLFSGWLHSQFPARRLLLALLCLPFVPLCAVSAVSLLSSLPGLPVNLLHFASPLLFVALLFTAHGTFHIADAWCRLLSESKRKEFSASERLASTFEQIAPSFLHFHLGPIVGFGVLSLLVPAPYYRSLCAGFSLTLTLCLFLQLFFFAPLLARLCHHPYADRLHFANGGMVVVRELDRGKEPADAKSKPSIAEHPPIIKLRAKNGHELIPPASASLANGGAIASAKKAKRREQRAAMRKQLRLAFNRRIIRPFAAFLHSTFGRLLLLVVTGALVWLAICRGIFQLRNNMDYRRLLPAGSPALRGFDLMDAIWLDFLQILYIVHRPPDFEDPEQFGQFKEFISAATSLPNTLNHSEAHMSWLFDYYRDQLHSDFFEHHLHTGNASESVDMSRFGQFIDGFPYRAWKSGVRYTFRDADGIASNASGAPRIDRMLVMIAYNQTQGLAGKRHLISQCRDVVRRFGHFQISVFDTDLRTTDIMDAVEPFLWRSIFGMFFSILLLSLPIFWHFSCSFLVLLSSASTFALLFGLGHLFAALDLDLLTVPTLVAIAPLCIQLGTQFLGDFLACTAKDDDNPFQHALVISTSSLAKISIVWFCLCLPSFLLSKVPFFALQAQLQFLAALLALWHGAFIVPMLMGLLIGVACCQGSRRPLTIS